MNSSFRYIVFYLLNSTLLLIFLLGFYYIIRSDFVDAWSSFSGFKILFIYTLVGVYLLRFIYFKYGGRLTPNVESAEQFIFALKSSKKEIGLILRPFGKDGYAPISSLRSGQFGVYFENWRREFTIEAIVSTAIKKIFNLETIALVNPETDFTPIGPKYIKSSYSSWKKTVFELLKYAAVVFVFIPPGHTVRESLKWELEKSIQLGLISRLIIIIPPMDYDNQKKIIESIKKDLHFLSSTLDDVSEKSIIIFFHDYDTILYTYAKHKKSKKYKKLSSKNINIKTYKNSIEEYCDIIKKDIEKTSFYERHMYLNKNYEEYDYNLTDSQLELFVRNRNKKKT